MVEPSFRTILATDPDIQSAVADRIYMNVKPQDERRPCLVLTLVSTTFARRVRGDSGATKGRMQVDCFAESYQVVKQLAAIVRQRLDGFTGDVAGTKFHYVEVEDVRDMPAAPITGRAVPLYAVSIDARFLHAT